MQQLEDVGVNVDGVNLVGVKEAVGVNKVTNGINSVTNLS